MHAYGGAKSGMAQALQSIWIPLAAAMVGTVGRQPLWADLGLRPVVGTTMDIKLWPRPLQHRDVVLLLSCWKRWDHGSISQSAINTWLKRVNMAYGSDCEDSPHFRRSNIDKFEAMRLFGRCGFDFLPETDLQQRPGLDVVMTVTSGGFLPIFWDAPSAYMHAATDIGSALDWLQSQVVLSSDESGCLAVLHNRNKMVATFGNSEWVTQSEGELQSKSVTSCAGMTAHFVLLAQTKVGFLSGGRSRRMKELPEKKVLAQLEEAYARATVALTRAQKLCIIMGPLDMRGLLGAATATVICENHVRELRTFFTLSQSHASRVLLL